MKWTSKHQNYEKTWSCFVRPQAETLEVGVYPLLGMMYMNINKNDGLSLMSVLGLLFKWQPMNATHRLFDFRW